jgi:hypothetical protein
MGWEVAHNRGRFVFFCNTSDVGFGNVAYLRDCLDEGMFYATWSRLEFPDPRGLDYEELSDCIDKMRNDITKEEE